MTDHFPHSAPHSCLHSHSQTRNFCEFLKYATCSNQRGNEINAYCSIVLVYLHDNVFRVLFKFNEFHATFCHYTTMNAVLYDNYAVLPCRAIRQLCRADMVIIIRVTIILTGSYLIYLRLYRLILLLIMGNRTCLSGCTAGNLYTLRLIV
jgi:hypothetical protein